MSLECPARSCIYRGRLRAHVESSLAVNAAQKGKRCNKPVTVFLVNGRCMSSGGNVHPPHSHRAEVDFVLQVGIVKEEQLKVHGF